MTSSFIYTDIMTIRSQALRRVAYNHYDQLLFVEFHSGGGYVYGDVTQDQYDAFEHASSAFNHLNDIVNMNAPRRRMGVDFNLISAFVPTEDDYAEGTTEEAETETESNRSNRYDVTFVLAASPGIRFIKEFQATSEDSAIRAADKIGSRYLPTKIVSVTRYFD